MIYRVNFLDSADGSQGFAFFTTRREADQALLKWQADCPEMRGAADIEARQTPRTRRDVLALLEDWATHADNG